MPATFSAVFLLCFSLLLPGADIPAPPPVRPPALPGIPDSYFWSTAPVGETAELLTLSCHSCLQQSTGVSDVPLLAVLRDTLGDHAIENDRLLYVWLLPRSDIHLGQRLLSAVPFFYWRIGDAPSTRLSGTPSPLLELNTPLHPVLSGIGHTLVQWAAFDPLTAFVRAPSRSYHANQADRERILLEQAISYLHNAPVPTAGPGLSAVERDTVLARLELRKTLLGGLVSKDRAASLGEQATFEEERVRIRNFESLRQFAEKTGTYFEPLRLAGASEDFGILWFPNGSARPATGTPTGPIWKVLNIRDPWSDARFRQSSALSVRRLVDFSGRLLPPGEGGQEPGVRSLTLTPLAVYSLNYPRQPLLLIDFRDRQNVRRHEILQRTITEVTGGIIGISHFANWYYYAGAMLYNTVWSRRGNASSQADRLDAYARFHNSLVLDRQLDPQFRQELLVRANSLFVNPLNASPGRDVANASRNYARLQTAAASNHLLPRLDKERRAELAVFQESAGRNFLDSALHVFTLGVYTHTVEQDPRNRANLDRDRRVAWELAYLDRISRNGTAPEVSVDIEQIERSIHQLQSQLGDVNSVPIRRDAVATLTKLASLTQNPLLQAECRDTVRFVNSPQALASATLNR